MNQAARISPPPLKRQRTRLEDDRTLPDRSRALPVSGRSASHRRGTPFNINSTKRTGHLSRHSSPGTSRKPKCRICMKDTNVKYDPIIACSTCPRKYHDSCRKPPLVDGTKPQDWRCFECAGGDLGAASRLRKSHARASGIFEPLVKIAASPLSASLQSVPVQSLATKARENTQQTPAIIPDLHEYGDARLPADECGDLRKTTDQRLHQAFVAGHGLDWSNDNSIDDVNSAGCLESAHFKRNFSRPSKSPSKSPINEHAKAPSPRCTEAPNTPTQRSSQLPVPRSLIDSNGAATQDTIVPVHDILHVEPTPPVKATFGTVLCTVCHKQRLLARTGSTKAVCKKCQDKSLVGGPTRLEIPETPESSADTQNPQHEQISAVTQVPQHEQACAIMDQNAQPTKVATAIMRLGPPEAMVPWFESGVVATKPKIKQKVGQLAHVDTLFDQDMDIDRNTLLCLVTTTLPSQDANATLQVCTTKFGATSQLACTKDTHLCVDESKQRECQNAGPGDHLKLLSDGRRTKEDVHSGPPSTSSRSRGEASTPASVSVPEFSTDNTVESEIEHSLPEAFVSKAARTSASSPLNSRNESSTQERYTVRQLARIALVSANGSRMTTSQVMACLARTFPYLRIGEGGWERSVQACLSRFDEFDGQMIPGDRRSRKLYGFKDVATRNRYEKEYPEFLATSAHETRTESQASCKKESRGKEPASVMRAKKSAISRSSLMKKQASPSAMTEQHRSQVQDKYKNSEANSTKFSPSMNQKTDHIRTEPPVPKNTSEEADNSFYSMPSARSVAPQSAELPNLHHDIERVFTFQAAFAGLKPSVEMMTEVEKAQRIAEIKARPSRKMYFGEDHRLAHKHRYGLEDIHDERDGAWKPPRPTLAGLQPNTRSKVDMNADQTQNLRSLFNLPDNVIPMNDGYTELAFRDGTLVNGRLPRPRNVYRVGKLFGGELTVRMS